MLCYRYRYVYVTVQIQVALLALSTFTMSILRFLHSQLLVKPPRHTGNFTDQVVVVTGGNTGLGWEAARQLVTLGAAQVIITVRSHEKGQRALHDLRAITGKHDQIQYELLDMGSYQSVLDFSSRLSALRRLDAVVLNAGFARTDFAILEDNESMITVNVLSTMLLATRLVPVLRSSANKFGALGRICIVTSDTHEWTTLEAERKSDSIFDALSDIESAKMHERYDGIHMATKLHMANPSMQILCFQASGDFRCTGNG